MKYSHYKDSGIPYLGLIPNEWDIVTVGRMCNLGRGRVISNLEIEENKGDYPVYSSQTANDGVMGYINTYDFEGDYVTWTTDGAYAGTVFYRTGKFNCTNVCGTMQPKVDGKIYLPFMPHLLNNATKFFVRQDINPKLMNNMMAKIPICLPSFEEQFAIANYLEEHLKQIDEVINFNERLFGISDRKTGLLVEYKNALIYEAVTGKIKIQ